jgi:solute carrier family 40 (iron-regulated transporter), member 1
MTNLRQPFHNDLLLYTMHFFFAFVSRIWQIGIVLLLAQLTNNSLFFVALSGLFSSCCIFIFSSSIGDLFDRHNRMTCMTIALLIKMISVSIGYFLCGEMLLHDSDETDLTTTSYQIYFIPVICAIADLSFSVITMNIEKDWVVVLSNGNSGWLSKTNSIMTQIDLSCNAIAPIVAGILFSFFDYHLVAFILLGVNGAATLGLYIFLRRLYDSWETLSIKTVVKSYSIIGEDLAVDGLSPVSFSPFASPRKALSTPINITPTLLGSGCAGAMISFSLLYLTVLSFGSLMLVYLKWCGIPDHWIGISRGLAAISGFTGAWIYPYASQVIGIKYLAKLSIWWQSSLVLVAAFGVIFSSRETGCWIMIVAVVSSIYSPLSFLLLFSSIYP